MRRTVRALTAAVALCLGASAAADFEANLIIASLCGFGPAPYRPARAL